MTVEPEIDVERERYIAALRKVMSTPEGRCVMWHILDVGNIFRKCFTGNSTTNFLEGKRELTLEFYADIMDTTPDMFFIAQRENIVTKETRHAR